MQHNVLANDINNGKIEYAMFRKVGLNNNVSFFALQCVANGSSMGLFLFEEAFMCYSC